GADMEQESSTGRTSLPILFVLCRRRLPPRVEAIRPRMPPSQGPRPLKVRTIPQMVADDIRSQILRGDLRTGDALPSERELRESYRLSRPTLREAMRILEAESLIETIRGKKGGAVVTAPEPEVAIRQAGIVLQLSGTTIADVYFARSIIEPPAVRL